MRDPDVKKIRDLIRQMEIGVNEQTDGMLKSCRREHERRVKTRKSI